SGGQLIQGNSILSQMIEAGLQQLINRVARGVASAEDFRELAAHVKADDTGALAEYIHSCLSEAKNSQDIFQREKWEGIAEDILSADKVSNAAGIVRSTTHRVHFLRKWGWAAAILILLGTGIFLQTTS